MKKIFSTLVAVALAAFTFTSCEDIPAPYNLPGEGNPDGPVTEVTPEGDGTQASPFNVAAVNEECAKLEQGATSSQTYYFTGKVVSFKSGEEPGNSYGNSTFYISDDGTSTKQFYVYRCYAGPNNKKFTSADELQIGDLVTICAKLTNYNGTLETAQNTAYVTKIVRNGEEVSGQGGTPSTPTETIEVSCAKAAELCNELADNANSTEVYSVTGYITDVYANISQNQQSFWMDDTKDGGKVLQAYWANLPAGVAQFEKGSKVKITGSLLKYVKNGAITPEIKNADVVILETAEGGNNGDGNNNPPTTGGEGVTIDGTNVTLTNSSATASATTTTLDLSTLGFENGVAVTTVNFPDGATATFDANGETNGPKYYTATNGVRVYKNNTITFNGKQKIAKVVFVCDSYQGTNYVGNTTATVTFSGNGAVYTNLYTEPSGGGVQLRVKTITIYYAN